MDSDNREKPLSRLVVMVPEELIAGLNEMAELKESSVSEVLRDLVTNHLFRNQWKSIGEVARDAILANKSNEEALVAVLKAFPNAATSTRSISWYRSELRRQLGDERVPTDSAIKRMRQRKS